MVSNSVAESFHNAFHIPTFYTTIVLVIVAAVIVLRKNATVKVLDIVVPIMAVIYFGITIFVILTNLPSIPGVFARIFKEAFGIRQVAAGGFGAVLMNGVKRGLFSNEAGSGSAPCAAAAADCECPAQMGLVQALGVFIDTIVICSCTAMLMLLAPQSMTDGLTGMNLLQTAMNYHLGSFGVIFIAVILWMFSFSTFLGILFYARSNVAYLFGDNWTSQTAYKVLALVMLFIGGIQTYTFVWDLGDVGIGLMTIFNIFILYAMSGQAIKELKDYEADKKKNIEERGTLYLANMITSQLQVGDDYTTLKKSIVIFITNYNFLKRNSYHSIGKIKFDKTLKEEYVDMGYKTEDEEASKYIEFHYIELPKYKKKTQSEFTKLDQWMCVFTNRKGEMMLAEKENKEIKKAMNTLDYISSDPKERERHNSVIMDEYNRLISEQNFFEAGKEEGIIETAKEMLKENIPIETIEKVTKLSREEIEKLK